MELFAYVPAGVQSTAMVPACAPQAELHHEELSPAGFTIPNPGLGLEPSPSLQQQLTQSLARLVLRNRKWSNDHKPSGYNRANQLVFGKSGCNEQLGEALACSRHGLIKAPATLRAAGSRAELLGKRHSGCLRWEVPGDGRSVAV